MVRVFASLKSLGSSKLSVDVPTPYPGKKQNPVLVGRFPGAELVLNDMHISSRHFTLSVETIADERVVLLTDTSTNGTWVNGERVPRGSTHPIELRHNDQISLPCEPENMPEYTFVFTYENGEREMKKASSGGANHGTALVVGNRDFDKLEAQCDDLTKETGRVSSFMFQTLENASKLEDLVSRLSSTSTGKNNNASHSNKEEEFKQLALDMMTSISNAAAVLSGFGKEDWAAEEAIEMLSLERFDQRLKACAAKD